MNAKTVTLNLLAAALLLGAGTANAAKPVSLSDSIRLQMRSASAAIEADMRESVKDETLQLDVPGVEAGPVRVAEAEKAPEKARQRQVLLETADAGMDASVGDLLRRDLAIKSLEVPGLYGVYRYMAIAAINAAVIVAE